MTDDMLGMSEGEPYKFVKRFSSLRATMLKAVSAYGKETRDGKFPAKENEFSEQ